MEQVLLEAEIGRMMKSHYILRFMGLGEDKWYFYFCYERFGAGTLAEYLKALDKFNWLMSRKEALSIVAQIADALASLHACNIVHRNLNPASIWL